MQFGSLVVCLPVTHQGGQLAVRNGGKELVFDWSAAAIATDVESTGRTTRASKKAKITPAPAPSSLQWAAFYSDCEHEVFEVTSGHRITLTYNLYATRGAGHLTGHASSGLLNPKQLPLYDTLKPALDTPGFFVRGRVLGVYLTHAYAHTSSGHGNLLPAALKGADMVLFETARALGLACYVRPIIDIEQEDDNYEQTTKRLMLPDFEGYHNGDWYDGEGTSLLEGMEYSGWSERIDKSKTTWLNEMSADLTQPAVGHGTVRTHPSLTTSKLASVVTILTCGVAVLTSESTVRQRARLRDRILRGCAADPHSIDG